VIKKPRSSPGSTPQSGHIHAPAAYTATPRPRAWLGRPRRYRRRPMPQSEQPVAARGGIRLAHGAAGRTGWVVVRLPRCSVQPWSRTRRARLASSRNARGERSSNPPASARVARRWVMSAVIHRAVARAAVPRSRPAGRRGTTRGAGRAGRQPALRAAAARLNARFADLAFKGSLLPVSRAGITGARGGLPIPGRADGDAACPRPPAVPSETPAHRRSPRTSSRKEFSSPESFW
jgi:hypothetical protein